MTTDFFRELAAVLEQTRDATPADHPVRQLLATCQALRAWATTRTAEFAWTSTCGRPAASLSLTPRTSPPR